MSHLDTKCPKVLLATQSPPHFRMLKSYKYSNLDVGHDTAQKLGHLANWAFNVHTGEMRELGSGVHILQLKLSRYMSSEYRCKTTNVQDKW